MPFIANTDDDRCRMLEKIGVDNFEELLAGIPSDLRHRKELQIPSLSEMELLAEIENLAGEDNNGLTCFAGGGVYDHFIPSAVQTIIGRPEFMTAYTPYQAEVSQGTLQVMYEFQTHICRLTGMAAANASMYDGATAAAEAIVMCLRLTRREQVVVSETVSPFYRNVIRTYLSGRGVELLTVPSSGGRSDLEGMKDLVDERTACVLISQPNFFGMLEEVAVVSEMVHKVGGKLILAVDPIVQTLLKTPAEYDTDVVVGEGQPLGNSISYGGPLLGFFATRKEMVRSMPGRIAGRTTDVDGKPGYVLVLQTREQHIRREKATSNICTNQALCATAAAVYMTLLGKAGLRKVALLSTERASELAERIFAIDGYEPYFDGPFVREFAIRTPRPAQQIILEMVNRGFLAGIDAGRWYSGLDDCLIVAATEKRTEAQIKALVSGLKELSTSGVLSRM